jgi:hypothetical protein
MKTSFVLLVALLVLVPTAGAAQDFRSVVISQLDAAAQQIRGGGFRPDGSIFDRDVLIGMIPDGASAYMEVSLTAGSRYFFAAACDQDCSDLDLRLFQPGANEPFQQDVETDDTPVLLFTAPVSGRYLLAIDMAQCGTRMCYYGFRSFRN